MSDPIATIWERLAKAAAKQSTTPFARGVRLADLAAVLAALAQAEDRAVCSGCGQDVDEAGACSTVGCENGAMIPASELPDAMRAHMELLNEEREEWREELAQAEQDRDEYEARLAQAHEALHELIGAMDSANRKPPGFTLNEQAAISKARALAGEGDTPA